MITYIYEIRNVITRKEKTLKENEAWLIGHRISALVPFETGSKAIFFNPAFPFNEFKTKQIKEIHEMKDTTIIISKNAMYFLKKLPLPSNNFHE